MSLDEYEFLDNYISAVTGISDIDFKTLRNMMRPFNFFHAEELQTCWKDTIELLKKLFQTTNDVLGVTGTIRVAFDAIISNVIEQEDKVLVLANGYWGKYAARVVRSYGGTPVLYEEAPTRALDPKKVKNLIENHRDLKAVTIMHVETDTGLVHPVKEIGKIVKENSDGLYIVDCAASLGGMKVEVDEWQADFCFSGSHKCLASPVGLALITVSNYAWKLIGARKTPIWGTYNNLLSWKEKIPGESRPPLSTPIVHAIRARLDYIFRHGPEKIFRRHEVAAKAIRFGIIEMGLSLLPESYEAPPCSNVVTVVRFPQGVDQERLLKIMRERYHILLVPSSFRGGVFPLGTINETQVSPRYILSLLTTLGLTLSELGVKIRLEEAITESNEILKALS